MTTSQHTHTGVRTRWPMAAKLAALTLSMMGAVAFATAVSSPSASAEAIGPAPHLDIAHGCVAQQFRYVATMTNTGLGSTHFDISVNGGSGATIHGYDVASGATEVATFFVDQSKYAFFDVSNVDDTTIGDHQQLTADCKPDPYTEIGLVCLHDGTTPRVYLEWVNLSKSYPAEFEVYLNGSYVGGGSSYGPWNMHYLSFDLFDGQYVSAKILADGVLLEEVTATVDCPPPTTTTETTLPPTTLPVTTLPPTNLPNTTLAEPPLPATTVADVETPEEVTAQPTSTTAVPTAAASPLAPLAATADHADGSLPETGVRSDALLALAIKMVLGGLGLLLVERRFR